MTALAGAGCASDPVDRVELDLVVSGDGETRFEPAAGLMVRLEEAQIAFGPLYLCAGRQAGELCESATAEWLESAVVDVLDSEPSRAGTLVGLGQTARSWMFDYGISSTLASSQLIVMPAAEELGEASARLSGEAEIADWVIPFVVELSISQTNDTEPGVPVVRSASSVELNLAGDVQRLEVEFSADAWMAALRVDDFVQRRACDGERAVTCQGQTEQRCDDSGILVGETDCAAAGQVCVPDAGCSDRLNFTAGSRAHRALVQAMISSGGPEFVLR